jgi:hypothetical protein
LSGKAHVTNTYSKITKNGRVLYDKAYKEEYPKGIRISAASEDDAKAQYKKLVRDDYSRGGGEGGGNDIDSIHFIDTKVDKVAASSVVNEGAFRSTSELHTPMRQAHPVTYDFIPAEYS